MEKRRVGPEIRRLNNLIKREAEKCSARAELESMTGLHGWIIGHISHSETPIYQRDLEKRFSCRRSTISNVISLMEKNGLVTRVASKEDARLKEIVLTEKAKEIDSLIRADLDRLDARLKAGIEREELDLFFKTLDKIKANIEKENENA